MSHPDTSPFGFSQVLSKSLTNLAYLELSFRVSCLIRAINSKLRTRVVPPCDMIASDEYGCRDSRESEGERKQEFDVCLLTSEVKRPGAVDTPVLYTWVPLDVQLQLWLA